MKKIIINPQEFFMEWEKKNNPFYPSEMKYTRLTINQFLADYILQFPSEDELTKQQEEV